MIQIKSPAELEKMTEAGRITADVLAYAGREVKAGMTTKELDRLIHERILKNGAAPSFLGYGGFPASACISVNNEVIHGIPGKYKLKDGDIVSIDVGAFIGGFHGDSAATFPIGHVTPEAERLMAVTEKALMAGIQAAVAGNRVGDIGFAVENVVEEAGFAVVRQYVGHGIGREMHEAPEIPNYGVQGRGPRLVPGMAICIEPMVNASGGGVRVLSDNWTVVTASGSLSAHFEHTLFITKDGPPLVLTNRG